MKKFEYEIAVSANNQVEADRKMKAVMALLDKLTTEELIKAENAVNNPVQLALIKSKFF